MRYKKILYILLGIISFAIGFLGVILPILPTTPFLLFASFCFVRGSEKLDIWFKETKIYNDHLESFVKERAMTLKQKMSILLFADFMMLFPLIILDSLVVKGIIIIMIIAKGYYFFFKIKTIKK
ncbi:MAG: YbaN family protein [Clostridium sp.]|uniref:YbaN family protein n=1 Tax=Clostridium sp. TaxID=1506 RepID=UPI003024DA21